MREMLNLAKSHIFIMFFHVAPLCLLKVRTCLNMSRRHPTHLRRKCKDKESSRVKTTAYLTFRYNQPHPSSAVFLKGIFTLLGTVTVWRHICKKQILQLRDALTVFPPGTAVKVPLESTQKLHSAAHRCGYDAGSRWKRHHSLS